MRMSLLMLVCLALGCAGADRDPRDSEATDTVAGDIPADTMAEVPVEADVSFPPDGSLGDLPEGVEEKPVTGDLPADDDSPDAPGDTADEIAGPTEELPPFEDVGDPPRKLPFEFLRPPVGEPVEAAEVTAFTQRIAATLRQVGYFRWLLRTSTGVDATTGLADYLAWHNDVQAVKEGPFVTFRHLGHEHNMWIPSAKILSAAVGAYLHTRDWEAGKVAEQYCKGLTAVVKGFVYDLHDPAPWLMARSILPLDHDFTLDLHTWLDDGRYKRVEFSPAKYEAVAWNAETFPWPSNPTWGSIWVTNMRSKDDVRAITRTVPFLRYVVEDAPDAFVRDACAETLETMVRFHQDIVDHNYFIRTKDRYGNAYSLPCGGKDLGSYNCYAELDPANECCARLATDMIAYGERRTNDCGTCTGSMYDLIAPVGNIYNINIIWDFHMAAVLSSLVARQYREAYWALVGLAKRTDDYLDPDPSFPGLASPFWPSRLALYLVEAASVGLPLTAREVRLIHRAWDAAAEDLLAFPNWDLWDSSVPDGVYGGWTNWDWWLPSKPIEEINRTNFRPVVRPEAVPVQWFATLFEYCASPFRNPAGESFVDCDLLSDPSAWTE